MRERKQEIQYTHTHTKKTTKINKWSGARGEMKSAASYTGIKFRLNEDRRAKVIDITSACRPKNNFKLC